MSRLSCRLAVMVAALALAWFRLSSSSWLSSKLPCTMPTSPTFCGLTEPPTAYCVVFRKLLLVRESKLYKVRNQAPSAMTSANGQTFCLMTVGAHGWQPSMQPDCCLHNQHVHVNAMRGQSHAGTFDVARDWSSWVSRAASCRRCSSSCCSRAVR